MINDCITIVDFRGQKTHFQTTLTVFTSAFVHPKNVGLDLKCLYNHADRS